MDTAQKYSISTSEFSQCLIYSNLSVDARVSDIKLTCLDAIKFGIPRILVNAVNISMATEFCANSHVKVGAALSYPIGAYPPEIKGLEIEDANNNGADEIFMLMALGTFLDGFYDKIEEEMNTLIDNANNKPSYYMIETTALNDEQLFNICNLAKNSGIESIITCTNFKQGGYPTATIEQVSYLVECSDAMIDIVACGDIEESDHAIEFLHAGASRICTPYAVELIKEVT